jgi:hypothetical protein
MVWLFVRIHMMNQNAFPAVCEDVLAALPTRATRDNMNGDHTAFFNPLTHDDACTVSHKVYA